MKSVLSAVLALSLISVAFAADQPAYSTRLERPAGILKSPAVHEPAICRKDHEGLDLVAAEPVADATDRLNAAIEAGGDLVTVEIEELSCAYCIAAIEKAFSARAEVAAAYLNPHTATLSFVTVKDHSLEDALIHKLIKRRGYNSGAIRRGDFIVPASIEEKVAPEATTPQ
ncbi:MAG: hypothetical protein AAB227_04690 [Pseudomonadota bacterium]